jgi:hypothetical protein
MRGPHLSIWFLYSFIATFPEYLRETRNTFIIQRATLQLCTHGSVDIRTFATSTSAQTTITSNIFIDLFDDVEIHETFMQDTSG